MKEMIKRWHVCLYFVFLLAMLLITLFHDNGGHDDSFDILDAKDFSQNWQYEFEGGSSGITELPAGLNNETHSNRLFLSNTIPEITQADSLFVKIRHTSVKIYVGDELRVDTITGKDLSSYWKDMPGQYYMEIPLSPDDAGKAIVVPTPLTV